MSYIDDSRLMMTMPKEPLTDKEYVAKWGCVCPACRSEHVRGAGLEIADAGAYGRVKCESCEAEWEDVYDLTGYRNLKIVTTADAEEAKREQFMQLKGMTPAVIAEFLIDNRPTGIIVEALLEMSRDT